jgi:hypothetical protein
MFYYPKLKISYIKHIFVIFDQRGRVSDGKDNGIVVMLIRN